MKRIICILTTLVLTFATVLTFGACGKEIEDGSEITRVKFEIDFYNEKGEVKDTATVTAKLYTTFAPETTAKIIDLINDGWYNGVCVSNVTSSYARFGDYKLNDKGELVACDSGISTVKGEFASNGWSGNRLTVKEGALLLLRKSGVSEEAYNSGKATVGVCFSSSAPFEADEYCLFGQLLNSDGDKDADKESMAYLSSVERAKKIADTLSTEDGTKVYYVVKDENDNAFQGYYTYFENDGNGEYYKGLFTEEELKTEYATAEKLTEEEVSTLKKRIGSTDGKFEYFNLPVNKVIIKTASVVK